MTGVSQIQFKEAAITIAKQLELAFTKARQDEAFVCSKV